MPIYLCRHGQTRWNQLGILQGHLDSELTELGRQQARVLGQQARALSLDFILCSDLNRARETAVIASQALNLPIQISSQLRERDFGALQGLSRDQSPQWWQHYDSRHLQDALAIPGAESASSVWQRAHNALFQLLNQHPDSNVLLIGHGEWQRIVQNGLLSYPLHSAHHPIPDNAEIWCLDDLLVECA
ncbi:probable phosphoglycerate mutase [Ferrimonas sediminum]|uniref:Probable phosphoglycerate mutase n=1 Tax=Ferrimonas sediminum TaxID=718193 RepID=A0A1G8WLU9_9GAMM|nr:histidine phosphatase family protein [Ferrimonas sediminum]SDJ79358.1 probable phosphoglycerate mutase [Ferrimonas sediminum]